MGSWNWKHVCRSCAIPPFSTTGRFDYFGAGFCFGPPGGGESSNDKKKKKKKKKTKKKISEQGGFPLEGLLQT
eukprot:3143297-Amphidinium_carterae.1